MWSNKLMCLTSAQASGATFGFFWGEEKQNRLQRETFFGKMEVCGGEATTRERERKSVSV